MRLASGATDWRAFPDATPVVNCADLDLCRTLEFVWRTGEDRSALGRFIEVATEIAAQMMSPSAPA